MRARGAEVPDSVEIVVRLAGELVAVTRILPGGTYRIGSAPDVDLPLDLSPLTSLPLIGASPTGFVVRAPAGIPITRLAAGRSFPLPGTEHRLERGSALALALGAVTITLSLVPLERAPLERPAVEWRPVAFSAASLVAHVAVVLLAHTLRPPPSPRAPASLAGPQRGPVRIARAASPQPARSRVPPRADTTPGSSVQSPSPILDESSSVRGRGRRRSSPAVAQTRASAPGWRGGRLEAAVHGLTDRHVDVQAEADQVGPVYDEDAATRGNFGNARRFDPAADPDFATVKTGHYATVGTGHAAGEHYEQRGDRSVVVVTCTASSCLAVGGVDGSEIRSRVEARLAELVGCYQRHAPPSRDDVVLDLAGARDGVEGQLASGGSAVEACVARVIASIELPAGDRATQVKYRWAASARTDHRGQAR